jgi:glycosyltransferase involved in cell wall biosynthesis
MKVTIFARDLSMGGVERCVALVGEQLEASGIQLRVVLLVDSVNLWQDHMPSVEVVDISAHWQARRYGRWLAAARRLAADSDVVIAAGLIWPLYAAWLATRGLSCRLIAWVHIAMQELDHVEHMNPVHRGLSRMVYRSLREIVFVSHSAAASMQRWLGVEAKPGWRVIHNFVEPQPPRPEGPCHDPVRLLFVGRVAQQKNPLLMIDMMAEAKAQGVPCELSVVGDGPLLPAVRERVQALGLADRVHILGQQRGVSAFLQQADLLLLTSIYEGLPLVMLEAMEAGLPMLTTNFGGASEVFAESSPRFIAPAATPAALVALLREQAADYPALCTTLAARRPAFAPAVIIAAWQALLEQS